MWWPPPVSCNNSLSKYRSLGRSHKWWCGSQIGRSGSIGSSSVNPSHASCSLTILPSFLLRYRPACWQNRFIDSCLRNGRLMFLMYVCKLLYLFVNMLSSYTSLVILINANITTVYVFRIEFDKRIY